MSHTAAGRKDKEVWTRGGAAGGRAVAGLGAEVKCVWVRGMGAISGQPEDPRAGWSGDQEVRSVSRGPRSWRPRGQAGASGFSALSMDSQ